MAKTKVKDLESLKNVKEKYLEKQKQFDYTVLICSGAGCISSDCEAVKIAFDDALKKYQT